jgi:hypothetical protein
MHLIVKKAEPQSDRERNFHLEAPVDEFPMHAESFVVLDGKEYVIEIHF